MPRTNAQKLQIKPGDELIYGPGADEHKDLISPLPEDVTEINGIDRDTTGVAVMFATTRNDLDALLDTAVPRLTSAKAVWIGYLKGGKSDVNRDIIWTCAEDNGWTLNGNVSLSETWSCVRLKPLA